MEVPVKPIFLLADSQLLFFEKEKEDSFLRRALAEMNPPERTNGSDWRKVAYIGASNGDRPEFFELFKGAMAEVGVDDCRLIPTDPSDEDMEYFDEAQLLFFAGGDVRQGWRAFKANRIRQKLIDRYYDGAVLMGLSAGAIQLGLYGWWEKNGHLKLFETWKLVPAIVSAHEDSDWPELQRAVKKAVDTSHGLGIPAGGGAILHQDLTLEPIRHPVFEVRMNEEGEWQKSLLFPGEASGKGSSQAAPKEKG